jgi:acyl-CoA reductase-like NAD-dependent aldehyde dehydrogenase
MKAIVLNEYGDYSHLQLAERIPEPKPVAGEIEVKVAAAGLNPIDWKLRSGDYKAFMPIEFPFVPGVDVSGQVVELGSGVTQFKIGDRVLGFVKHMSDKQVESALESAAVCFEKWRHTSFAERAFVIAKAAGILHARVDDFARPMTLEMGKRINEARGEVEFSSEILAYYAKNAERFLAPVKLHPTVGEAYMESSPLGAIFCVEPWNFPYYQLARVAGPHSDFGLGGSVFTKDIARGKRVASRIDTGMMFINNISWADAELPFGGIKDSGYGRELGDMGIQEFVNKKLVRVAAMEAPA